MRAGDTPMVNARLSAPPPSTACSVNGNQPLVVGVPLMVALVPLPASVNPSGSAPLATLHVTLPLAPRLSTVALYGCPTRPRGRVAPKTCRPASRSTVSVSCLPRRTK
jgi:hypothetical protein